MSWDFGVVGLRKAFEVSHCVGDLKGSGLGSSASALSLRVLGVGVFRVRYKEGRL